MRTARTIGFLVLALAGAALVWFSAGTIRASRREQAVEAAWARSFGPLADIPAKFPAHPTNVAAHALEESARTLGIELGPREEPSPQDELSRPKKTDLDAVRAPLEKWVDHEAAKAEGLPDAPPAAVAAYFVSHAATLDAIEESLLAGPAPDWAVDLAKLHAAPAPNVLGHMLLARVLVGRAEARAAAKDVRADESLRAAFTLTAALRGRPDVASQGVAIAATRLELGAMRRIPVDAAAWRERLKALDPRGGLLAALRRGAWVEYEAAKRLLRVKLGAGPLSGRLAARDGAWRERIEAAGYLDAWRATIEAAAKSPVTDTEPRFLVETFQQTLERGGIKKKLAVPNLLESWRRANIAALEIRKTDEILAARGEALKKEQRKRP
jgi:hypothetical protein